MGKSKIKASIKKIEIINKVNNDDWDQSIRIVLGDIELNDDNLIELKKFRPNEAVNVSFESQQLSLLGFIQPSTTSTAQTPEQIIDTEDLSSEPQDENPFQDFCLVEDLPEPDPKDVLKEFVL